MTRTIRPFEGGDRAAWDPLWEGYLTFYETSLPPDVSDMTWARLMDPREPIYGLGAWLGDEMVGIAHTVYHGSTWSIAERCYLNDLFTAPSARGRGVARALIEAVYDQARVIGAERVYWLTHESNTTAQALYDRVATRTGFIQYKHSF